MLSEVLGRMEAADSLDDELGQEREDERDFKSTIELVQKDPASAERALPLHLCTLLTVACALRVCGRCATTMGRSR